jgi:hypothetical protein
MNIEEPRLRRKSAADFLTEQGYPTSPATLEKMASIGGGPVFELYGRIPLYKPDNLLVWARSRLSPPRLTRRFLMDGTPDPGWKARPGRPRRKPAAPDAADQPEAPAGHQPSAAA